MLSLTRNWAKYSAEPLEKSTAGLHTTLGQKGMNFLNELKKAESFVSASGIII